jgi:hypothetical protein
MYYVYVCIRRPKIFVGKADLNDVVTAHASTSRTHAAIVIGTLSTHAGNTYMNICIYIYIFITVGIVDLIHI